MAESLALRFRTRLPVVVAVVVLSVHAAGTALSGLWFGPPLVLALSSALAAGLWAIARAGRRGPLPAGVRWALLAVWLVPPLALWMSVGWEALFPSPREPVVPLDSPWCRTEAEPAAAAGGGA